ncbi:MBL fold metallo-hydrolase [Metabacillus sp. GX 13764]|uniref:MBL fold metallo-hydrolase n=1 Tax=Metabacillus kandeliae TaxID=2900151 RepID=UPI001E3C3183|nr:MBL fold metallo-hydrolase [Metabacillus kandeliae]MCD7036084.1 MBL fold metallo-hydrolase [Metabacillus kandeliae]
MTQFNVADGVHYLRTIMANVIFVSSGNEKDWVLVDAGVGDCSSSIIKTANELFGTSPKAIIMTHGHFDHVGALRKLAETWDVPVYAHETEMPYLTGKENYSSPDPAVGKGMMSLLSPLYPKKGIDLGNRVQPLPKDFSVPFLPDWEWVYTPGHTAGHVSFFRKTDKVLIAGDAFTTVKQESFLAVATQKKELHGPPAYFTTDWAHAEDSVEKLAALDPETAITGHGRPFYGEQLHQELQHMKNHFRSEVIPKHGKYVNV